MKRKTIDLFDPQPVTQRYYVQHSIQMIEYCQLISPHDPEHPDYNRGITGINRRVIEKIKAEFDPNKVNLVKVSLRDGKYYIIDGQHTTVALYELNDNNPQCLIQCLILTGLSHEDEARMFISMNVDIQKLKLPDKIWALIISGDENAKEFKRIVNNSGYDYEFKSPKQISAVSACWTIFNNDSDMLAEILSITSRAWPDNGKAISNVIMNALKTFMIHHSKDYEKDWLIRKLSETSHKEIETVAKVDNENSRDKDNETKNYCAYREIVRMYNHNKTSKKRLRLYDPRIDGKD